DHRGGLNLISGRVYATFADLLAFDKGTYHGWVVGCDANDLRNQVFFPVTSNLLGGGVWGPGGAAADLDTLYIATGNAPNADDDYWNTLTTGGDYVADKAVFEKAVGGPSLVNIDDQTLAVAWKDPGDVRQKLKMSSDGAAFGPTLAVDDTESVEEAPSLAAGNGLVFLAYTGID